MRRLLLVLSVVIVGLAFVELGQAHDPDAPEVIMVPEVTTSAGATGRGLLAAIHSGQRDPAPASRPARPSSAFDSRFHHR